MWDVYIYIHIYHNVYMYINLYHCVYIYIQKIKRSSLSCLQHEKMHIIIPLPSCLFARMSLPPTIH